MAGIPRHFVHLALLLSVLTATSLSTSAQEVTDRQLIPAFDFATIQVPVEIVSIRLNGKEFSRARRLREMTNGCAVFPSP